MLVSDCLGTPLETSELRLNWSLVIILSAWPHPIHDLRFSLTSWITLFLQGADHERVIVASPQDREAQVYGGLIGMAHDCVGAVNLETVEGGLGELALLRTLRGNGGAVVVFLLTIETC